MGSTARSPEVQKQLRELQEGTASLGHQLEEELKGVALDAIGIVDPTPISDAIGLARSAAQGDWIGAGLSLISMLPYAGDAIGKTAKGARAAKRILELRKRIADNAIRARQILTNALKKDAAAIRARRAADKGKKIEDSIIEGCPVGGNRFGTQSPKEGWVNGERGHGDWDPRKSGLNQEKIAKIESITGGKPVRFEEGYPQFSEYTYKARSPDGATVDAKVEIELSPTGDRQADFNRARQAMKEKLGVDDFHEDDLPGKWTWHHKEDGTTLELIPSELHNNVPHAGGVSLARDPTY
jgi:hypothetical protein